MNNSGNKYGARWTRDETILAMYLYCQIPFSKTKRTTLQVRQLAARIGRTPSAVARKLGNLGSFDEALAARGVSGLSHTSQLDRQIWDEFHNDWNGLVSMAQRIFDGMDLDEDVWFSEPTQFATGNDLSSSYETERETRVKARRGQAFFRRTILASYEQKCCVCGLGYPRLLVASHIVPWAVNERSRLDPQNGLALCSLHDRLFDVGLMTLSPDLTVVLSAQLYPDAIAAESMILRFRDRPITRPSRFEPRADYLDWHREYVFEG